MDPRSDHAARHPPEPDDEAIWRWLCDPNPEQAEAGIRLLLNRYGGRVVGGLKARYRDVMSEDELWGCLNEALFKAWRAAGTYEPARSSFGAWFFLIAQRTVIDELRGRHSREERPIGEYDPSEDPDEDATPRTAELVALLDRAIEGLPPLQRAIIRADLAAGTEAADDRLAELHGTSTESIRVSRRKARANLRRQLDGQTGTSTRADREVRR